MASSWFRYNVSRPYPFRWFTPVVIAGFIIFTILLTFLNFVTTGYTLLNKETSNPNSTISSKAWMQNWPSWISHSVKPTCENVDIAVGEKVFTNQTALRYTLTDVWQTKPGNELEYAYIPDSVSPFLTYHNNVIQNCTINSIELDYAAIDRTATQFAFSNWGIVVRTFTTCSVSNARGTTMFNLTQEYDYVPEDISFAHMYEYLGTEFLSTNATQATSLYWGQSLISMYWAYSSKQMQDIALNQTTNNQPAIRKGLLYFYPNPSQNPKDIAADTFFNIDYRFIVDEGRGNYTVISPSTYGKYEDYTNLPTLLEQSIYPNIWNASSILAKATYSTILTDLGQTNSSSPNILASPSLLANFTSEFINTRRNISNAYPGPTEFPYTTGNLTMTPSVFSLRYQCEVPRRKPAGQIFVSVLVADLVMLQALWFLWSRGVSFLFLRNRTTVNHCEGCIAQMNAVHAAEEPGAPPEGLEMGGLKAAAQPRTSLGPYSRDDDDDDGLEERLIVPRMNHSLDIGYRHLE